MLVLLAFLIILLKSGNIKGELELSAFKTQTMNCNEKTILRCNISSSTQLNILKIYWKKHGEHGFECDAKSSYSPPGFECNYSREALTLTILHSTPAKMGRYFCAVRADSGHGSREINLSFGECSGEFSHQMTGSKQMQCSFTGVYPEGTINWFHYDKNMTSNSTITVLENADGTFNITSVLNIQDNQDRYNCSLWSPKHGRYLKDQEIETPVVVGFSPISKIGTHLYLSCPYLLLALIFSMRIGLSL